MHRTFAVVPLLALLLMSSFAGCSNEVEPVETDETTPPAVATSSAEAQPPKANNVVLTEASNEELKQIVAEHAGKIVIVDFWATWCHNCLELMPHTAALQQQHANDLVVVTMSLDDPEKAPLAKEFLARLDGELVNLISSVGGGPKSLDEYGLDYGPPHYMFFDRTGKLAKVLDSDPERLVSEESIDAAVKELLAGEASAAE